VNHPNPAIVSKAAARRLPRLALILLCVAYVIPGFIGRDSWKSEDMAALGFAWELLQDNANWWAPSLMGLPPDNPALLPYWLGAWSIKLTQPWVHTEFAVRIPFGLLLSLTLVSTWYAVYYLGRSPKAQPVAFAFGGEALPTDYARAMADGGLLAVIACMGLAQLSHEATPALAQLGFSALFFFGASALPYSRILPLLAIGLGLLGMTLSGAPAIAGLWAIGAALIHVLDRFEIREDETRLGTKTLESGLVVLIALVCALVAQQLDLWNWKLQLPKANWVEWSGFGQLLIWFTWPTWPLALWTLWRWRHQLFSRHISRHLTLPLWLCLVAVAATLLTGSSDRTLLLALPAMSALAAFALPTLKRQVAALIDWFTLLFFTGCAVIIWVIWIAMQTGIPSQPAANVARLAPGFETSFSVLALAIALCATTVWGWLVHWRVGRHRAAIWKSLVLPAGGAALCWLLLMTLWMPLLNYAQGYKLLVNRALAQLTPVGCVEVVGLGQGQIAALKFYADLQMQPMQNEPTCPWLIAELGPDGNAPSTFSVNDWNLVSPIHHPTDRNQSLLLFKQK
jgi:4-amino-4-deoxy-L-arabinose transferase-like glycosyltransferase